MVPKMQRIATLSCLLCGLLLLSCNRDLRPTSETCSGSTPLTPGVPGSPGHLIPSELNPNGASELATLMRRFVSDLRETRAAITSGEPSLELWSRHARLRCAWPTDPADRNEAFDAQALVYLALVRSLDSASSEGERRKAYEAVLDGCRACHEASCPGPIELIESLRLPGGVGAAWGSGDFLPGRAKSRRAK